MTWLRALLAMFICAGAVTAGNWPQWRGPTNDGHSAEMGLPTEWGVNKNVAWKLKMPGIGACTPVVWRDRIFVTSVDGNEVVSTVRGHRRQGKVEREAL